MEKKQEKRKEHHCIFCKQKFNRIQMHFTRKHKHEDKVSEIMKTDDKAKRKWLWKKLRQEGDHLYNIKDVEKRTGERITVKESQRKHKNMKYYDCFVCHGRIRTTSRKIHEKLCKRFLHTDIGKTVESGEETTEKDIYKGMGEKNINWIRGSTYLSAYIRHVFEEKENKQVVTTIVSDLKRLEETLREQGNQENYLCSYLRGEYVNNIIHAVQTICGEEEISGQKVIRYAFRAKRLCREIKNLAKFLMLYYSKRNMEWDMLQVSKFLTIFDEDSNKIIRNKSNQSIRIKKFLKPERLPQTSDICKLINLLKEETPVLIRKLEEKKDYASWRALGENILLRLTIFNRRRGGAVEKMQISEYDKTKGTLRTLTEESLYNLNKQEESFLKNMKVVEIMHKCGNIVPIYINSEVQDAMRRLHLYRETGGINPKNPYFFAAGKGSLKPMHCVKVMAAYRKVFPENKRHLFTSTNLRKQGATVAQVLKLSKQDREEWAMHMGHSLDVHNKYYKKPEEVDAILKTGRILNAMDEGILKYFKGKTITDLPLGQTSNQTENEAPAEEEKKEKIIATTSKREKETKKEKPDKGNGKRKESSKREKETKKEKPDKGNGKRKESSKRKKETRVLGTPQQVTSDTRRLLDYYSYTHPRQKRQEKFWRLSKRSYSSNSNDSHSDEEPLSSYACRALDFNQREIYEKGTRLCRRVFDAYNLTPHRGSRTYKKKLYFSDSDDEYNSEF